jgi:thiosulfate reductase cytochrome b subunit
MAAAPTPVSPVAEHRYHRHVVRVTHWINVVCFTLLLMSGLQIFNAHPALYVGERSDFDHPALSIQARLSESGLVGEAVILRHSFDTTGVLGVSSENGQVSQRAFPSWVTIPSYLDLATGRRWHFFSAWLLMLNALVYLVLGHREPAFRQGIFSPTVRSSAISGERS